jgi:FlaA1/EpsC-like NDP-sugar epimerase
MKKNNIYKFFIDDHIAARFISLDLKQKREIDLFIKTHNLINVLINKNQLNGLNIFGAGDITANILNKSSIVEDVKNIQIFDNDSKKIGKKIRGITIDKPKNILNNNEKIYISVAQSFDDIFSYLISLKINPNRIISGLII